MEVNSIERTSTAVNSLRGASQFLINLPSRGLFPSTVSSSNPGGLRIYVCDHNKTSPPEEQIITTNQQNILIRSLTLKKPKNDSGLKDGKRKRASETTKGKRPAERPIEGRAKRATVTSRNSQQGSSSRPAEKGFPFQSLTVDKLRGLLKQRGLPTRGKKDELISRLKMDDNIDGET